MLGRESSSFYLDDLSREENGWYLRGSIVHWFGGRGPRNMPFPAVQQDLVVDKSINPGIISIEQQTFKSVEECLSGGRVRRPPHPENEASECKVRWMWRSHFQGRKRSHESINLQWRSLSRSWVEIRSLVLADLTPQEIAWRAELVNNLAAGTNKQRRRFSQRTFGGSSKRLSYDSKYSLVVR